MFGVFNLHLNLSLPFRHLLLVLARRFFVVNFLHYLWTYVQLIKAFVFKMTTLSFLSTTYTYLLCSSKSNVILHIPLTHTLNICLGIFTYQILVMLFHTTYLYSVFANGFNRRALICSGTLATQVISFLQLAKQFLYITSGMGASLTNNFKPRYHKIHHKIFKIFNYQR